MDEVRGRRNLDIEGQYRRISDELEATPLRDQKTCFQRWKGRVVSIAAAGAGLGVRLANLGAWSNMASSFATGFFAQAAITSGLKGSTLKRVGQVCLTTFGMTAIFAFGQDYQNPNSRLIQTIFDHLVVGQLGALTQNVLRWAWHVRAVRVESHALPSVQGDQFEWVNTIPKVCSYAFKMGVCGACVAGHYLIKNSVLNGIVSWGATFFGAQVLGEVFINFLDGQIQTRDSDTEGTNARWIKTAATSISHFLLPLSFIPWWGMPNTDQRSKQLVAVGAAIGMCDGVINESYMNRLKNTPVVELEEFQKIDSDEGEPASRCTRLWDMAYRAWRVASPLIYAGGLIALIAWKEAQTDSRTTRTTMGTMLGSYIATSLLCRYVDWTWDPNKRNLIRDKLMTFFFVSPRILGINPLYLYLVGTNSLRMSEDQENPFYRVVDNVAWASYGFALARESWVTSCDRKGSPTIMFPLMAISSGCIVAKLVGGGVIP